MILPIQLATAICLQLSYSSPSPALSIITQPSLTPSQTLTFAQPLSLNFSSPTPNNLLILSASPLQTTLEVAANIPQAKLLDPWNLSDPAPVHLLEPWTVGEKVPIIPVTQSSATIELSEYLPAK